ncbi:type II secretion system protein [Chitinispirillales bacterium ANBcel5]|uniref:hypothetical protein n=1 Tax=Cellulosispirillum alkaliphilum TaxID=3039283 RepID=UPI002A547F47|nr:type II secretion system protein [Chitinispirillales bacterium ANBcel5]
MEKTSKNGGFSIVEIIISLLLVSVALISIASVFPRITGHKEVIREVNIAYSLASDVLESLYNQSLTNPVEAGADTCLGAVERGAVSFTACYSVNWAGSGSFMKEAFVTVKWDKLGRDHNVSLSGIVK